MDGVDFTAEMLARARAEARKAAQEIAQHAAANTERHASTAQWHLSAAQRPAIDVTWLQGDALRLPLRDASVDIVTIAFGLRNVEDRVTVL